MDKELKKDFEEMNCDVIAECANGLLRMEKVPAYIPNAENIGKFPPLPENKRIRFSNKKAIILIAAAIIVLLMAATAFAYESVRYKIVEFGDHSIVSFGNKKRGRLQEKLSVGYIPEGYEITEAYSTKTGDNAVYSNGTSLFTVCKDSFVYRADINTEVGGCKEVTLNGITYIVYGNSEFGYGAVWAANGYQYVVSGKISEEELMKICAEVS